MAETMLKVDNINVYYGNIHAVKDVSFEVNEGEIVTLIGANGAGKSTTLKTISGLLHPKTGDILYKGKSIKGVRAHKIVEAGLAQVPEGRHVDRSSRAQFNQGDPVDKDKLQIGDLVFFTSPRSGRSIGHVGIVVDVDPISGSFNFIHASTKGVKVSNSNERYYSRRYVGARRVM